MCGITGYLGTKKISKYNIKKTLAILDHRGPDSSGYYESNFNGTNILLIHNRLKILDLNKRSDQPFEYQGTYLIFNGEIYNYLELKNELYSLGHKFKTSSDTEVISHAIKEWGLSSFKKFEGMWALIWFDKINKKILVSRDRFGEKPLFFHKDNDSGIYFSSEIKGIKAISDKVFEKNFSQINRYLISGYKSLHKTKETFYKKIEEFPKGYIYEFNLNRVEKKHRFWKPNFSAKNNFSFNENCEIIKNLLIKSVKLRLRSDVPLAFCLSSGIDSNSLISIANKILNYDTQGFSIDSKDKRYSERSKIEKNLKKSGIRCKYIKPNEKDSLDNLKKIIHSHDSPVSTISYYLHWFLLKEISNKNYKVSISGTGADEIFTGYYDHFSFHLAYLYKYNKKLYNSSLSNWKKYQKNMIRNSFLKDPRLFIKNKHFRKHIYQDTNKYKNFFVKKITNDFKENFYTPDLLRNRMLNELFSESVPVILKEDDLNAMCFSVENRSPFLDKELFEFSMTIPNEFLIQDGYSKNVLRKSMLGVVDDKILEDRRKIGFNASINEIIDFSDKKNYEAFLDNNIVFDIVKKQSIEKLLKKRFYSNSESKFLFNFINTKIFLEQ